MSRSLFALLLLFFLGCGDLQPLDCPQSPFMEKVVGGVPAVNRLSTVRVWSDRGPCTGVILGRYTALTAKHCITDLEQPITLTWGDGEAEAAFVLPHPTHDLALVHTTKGPLPRPYAAIGTEDMCLSLLTHGYGLPSLTLHERQVWSVDITENSIITTEGACNGDSGGALYEVPSDPPSVVGITSSINSTPRVCTGGEVSYVRLSAHRNWLERHTI